MPLFNPDKIAKLVSEIRRAYNHLNSLKILTKGLFLGDPDKICSASYNFIVTIEAAVDICNHIISENGYRAPEDYAGTFQILGDKGHLTKIL